MGVKTRRIITWEGEQKHPHILLQKGSLQWEEPIPVSGTVRHEFIGMATGVQREEDGSITAEIEVDPEYEAIIDEVSFTIYANEVVGERSDIWTVSSARIREVFVTPPDSVAWR